MLDKAVYSFSIKYKDDHTDVVYASNTRTNTEPTGTFTLVKKNADKSANLAGATYRIWSDTVNYDKTFTTDAEGKITADKLKLGNYKYQELQAPDGYLIDNKIYTFDIIYKDQLTSVIYENTERTNEEPTATITIIKRDSKTGSTPQGNATFEDAEYEVYAVTDIYNKAKTKRFYSAGEYVATRIMNAQGKTEDITKLPLGQYRILEKIASEGYLLDTNKYDVTLRYKDQNESVISTTVTSVEIVKDMQVHIFKSGIKNNAGLINGIEGAEFTIKLKSAVEEAYKQGYTYAEVWSGLNEYGEEVETDENRILEAQKIAPTYEAITTDKDGNAYTEKKLPYGTFIGKETKTPEDYECGADFTFSITQDDSEVIEIAKKVKHLVVNNTPLEAYVKLIKVDAKTEKKVSLNSATFQIKATEDIYDYTGKLLYKKGDNIVQKVGGTSHSSFTTNANNIVVIAEGYMNANDEKGVTVTPLKLQPGNYEVVEIQVPTGFLQLDNPVTFSIGNIIDLDKDQEGDSVKEVIISNEQPTGTINIHKDVALNENADTSLIDTTDLSEIQFLLKAKEDIVSAIDGSIIYKKGTEIKTYNLDKNGDLVITELPLGIYEIYEIKTLDGLVLNNTKYEVKFTQEDLIRNIYEVNQDIINEPTEVEFSKKSITGDNELIGAELTVLDEAGNIIDSWLSTENTHKIEGLKPNNVYVLRENLAPLGYVKSTDVKFTVKETGEIQKVEMIDKIVEISKKNIAGEEIPGAKLQVFDINGNLIDEWVSTTEPHKIKGLEENMQYGLHEELASEGYVVANDIEFTVTTDKELQHIDMVDKIVEISKVDVAGDEIEGATMQVIDDNGNIVDEWISTKQPHKIKGLKENEHYILHEVISGDDYVIATDIEFVVSKDKETQHLEMIDKIVEISKKDIAGDEISGATLQVFDMEDNLIDEWVSTTEAHKVKGLKENTKYRLHEKIASQDYVIASDIEFIVTAEKINQKIEMIDKIVEISKKDIAGDEVPGAKLQVFDMEDNLIDEWVSTEEPHKVKGLKENTKYRLHEEVVANGYVKASDIEFTVSTDKETQKMHMIDKRVLIPKKDITNGEELEGAELVVTDEDGNEIDRWISTDKPHFVNGLEEGKKYVLTEVTCPYGYEQAENITFMVTENKATQVIEMQDKPILKSIKLVKTDAETNEIIKAKFTFGIYEDEQCDKLIKEIESDELEGTVLFNDLHYGIFYIKEVKAPKDYVLSDKIVKVEINNKGIFVDNAKVENDNDISFFEFTNIPVDTPDTGDNSNLALLIGLSGILTLSIIGIIVYKTKKEKQNKE